jgi:hypothetical protein
MKSIFAFLALALLLVSCSPAHIVSEVRDPNPDPDPDGPPITQSLFTEKSATISEENIQKLLNGSYKLPQQLRVAVLRLDNPQKRYYWYYWGDETYLKTQQAFLDSFTAKFKESPRVAKLMAIPDLLMSK